MKFWGIRLDFLCVSTVLILWSLRATLVAVLDGAHSLGLLRRNTSSGVRRVVVLNDLKI